MNISHITNLFRAYFIENKRMLLICSIIIFGFVAFGFAITGEPEISPSIPFLILIFLAGTFFQSSLKRNNSTHFFNLPVSTGEKFIYAICTLIILGIAFELLTLTGAYTGRYLIRPLFYSTASMNFRFNICESLDMNWHGILTIGYALSVFLFGSIYFKKNAFWKTIACGLGFLFGIAFYSLGLLYIAFLGNEEAKNANINIAEYSIIFHIVFIVFFLSLTYLRLRETEV